jgi:HTH-type transcriptional regulator/antitoxin HipB
MRILPKGDNRMNPPHTFPIHTADQLSVHIKSLRKARGLTQAQLGERLGVKQVRVADIERNPGSVSVEQLLSVLHALDARVHLTDAHAYAPAPPTPPHVGKSPSADW